MKIIRHTARDMRQALRAVREQLGEDAVILSSRRTGEGVEVTAAVDFDATTLEAGGFSATMAAPSAIVDATLVTPIATRAAPTPARPVPALAPPHAPAALPAARRAIALPDTRSAAAPSATRPGATPSFTHLAAAQSPARHAVAQSPQRAAATLSPTALALTTHRASRTNLAEAAATFQEVATFQQVEAPAPEPAPSYDELASMQDEPSYNSGYDADWISEAAREAVMAHAAPIAEPAFDDPVEEVREATLTPLASNEVKAAFAEFQAPASPTPAATEAMGNELKTLRRMLETQLAHLAWNDLTRRAPVHTEILRELTEIGITQDLAEHLVRQLPEDTELTFARRFTIAGLSQYLKVTGDRWLDDGGRVAFAGATGVGKTTTLAKIAVRWVLRHGPRDIALVAGDSVRIGAQDQLQSLAQLLGVPVYTPEKFEHLPALLSRLNERLILIDTPGSS
ncbi:MAG TPA: flagellar biosynthesis protein FlhF, partial [Steroidobacteraceae bacterium]|nr:flagellar biosynthesis protein FlhF [Steroidobacteraceae bacterium]